MEEPQYAPFRARKNRLSDCPRQVKIAGDNQITCSGYPTDKFISQLLLDPQKSMTYLSTLELQGKVVSGLVLGKC